MRGTHDRRHPRILAVDPSPQGFGFAVLEGPRRLLDWGVEWARGDKSVACLQGTEALIKWYGPKILVVEDTTSSESRRGDRVRALFPELRRLAARLQIIFAPIPWASVRETCGGSHRATKEAIAAKMASRFPPLAPRLPPHRKIWMPEDPRMNIFDAVALAVTSIERRTYREKRTVA